MKKIVHTVALVGGLCASELLHAADATTYQHAILANYYLQEGNSRHAARHFGHLRAEAHSPYALEGYVYDLFRRKQFHEIVRMIPELTEPFADNPAIRLLFAHALANTGDGHAASAAYVALNQSFPANQEAAFYAANASFDAGQHNRALQIIDTFLNKSNPQPKHFIFHYLKSQIYAQLDDSTNAVTSIKESLELYPQFGQGQLLLGMLQQQARQCTPSAGPSTTKRADKKLATRMSALVAAPAKTLERDDDDLEYAFHLCENGQHTHALAYLNRYLTHHPDDEAALLLKINVLSACNDAPASQALFKELLTKHADNELWFNALHLLHRTGQARSYAIDLLKDVAHQQPRNFYAALYLGDLYAQEKETENALTHLQRACDQTRDTKMQSKILFQMGLLCYHAKRYDQMCTLLDRAHRFGHHGPSIDNLLAYYYAKRGNDMGKAQELLNRALKAKPGSVHFLDTQAMIWAQSGKLDEAQKLLQKLGAQAQTDEHILRHLRKVSAALNAEQQKVASVTTQ